MDLLQYCVEIKYGRVAVENKTGREISRVDRLINLHFPFN